ncbi:MAG TPA: hypothetical protein VFS64_10005 [Solirubrobacterales bacterium]|nr:hypothetical protein [Solirubrobacterales bacterium]
MRRDASRWAIVAALLLGVSFPGGAKAAGPPLIPASWVESVTANSANLRAEIDPNGILPTHYRFEYIAEADYLANLDAIPPREGFFGAARSPTGAEPTVSAPTPPVFRHLEGLASTTSYYYRSVATNSAGTTIGPEHVLATEEPTNQFPPIDGRGWELVSPVDKAGGAVGSPEALFGGGDFQAAADGVSFTFSSTSSFGSAAGAPPVSQYVSTRGGAGWSTSNVSAPLESGGYGDHPDGAPYRVFSDGLARALMLNGARCAVEGTCPPSYSLWEGGGLTALPTAPGLRLAGATADLAHAVFAAEGGLYEWSGGALETVSPGPGAVLAAPIGAISENGRRVYRYQLEDGPIELEEVGGPSKALPGTVGVGAAFQAASADGRFAFYTVASHLYRYDAASETAADLTPAGGVAGVLGSSASGDTAYYQDATGLERWHEGTTTTVAEGAVAAPSDHPPAAATARVSPDGAHLAFLSAAEIPPFDNIDANTGQPDTELYLYGPAPGGGPPRLVCASCNPTGERPQGSASIPGAVANGSAALYRPRALSAGGSRVFFDSADRLVTPDTDSRPDVYEWEATGVGGCTRQPGCVGLVSGGHSEGGRFLDASADGRDAFFLSGESLVGADPGSIDVYDDREGGGFPEPEPPFVCKGDACQALPSPPEDPAPATLVPTSGNPPLKIEKPKGKKHRCRKGKVRRHGRCVKGNRHRRGRAAG